MRHWAFLAFALSYTCFAQAQQSTKRTVSGYVTDSLTGEDLIAVSIYDEDDVQFNASTNVYGFYSLTIPAGTRQVSFAYIGYETKTYTLNLGADTSLNVQLKRESKEIESVVITGKRDGDDVRNTNMGTIDLPLEDVKEIPALFGEVDILKTLQLLPGVQSGGEGTSGFYVRGGGPDQNLVLLDEAVVFNPGHLFGFFSVFNADALKNTTLIKGGMPANYGGRLSSVVDISMKEGNNKRFGASGGIGLISSKLTLEGPIVKDKSSFMISGRRTYIDVLLKPFLRNTDLAGNAYYFYDLNTKVNYKIDDKNRLFLSGYFGRDVFAFTSSSAQFNASIPWGNATATARWNHVFSNKLFLNVSAIYNSYKFDFEGEQLNLKFIFGSGIRDFNVKADFDYYPTFLGNIKYGLNYVYHIFTPSTASFALDDQDVDVTTSVSKKFAHELAGYALYERDLGKKLRFNAGIRYSAFQQVGPYESPNPATGDTAVFGRLAPVKTYTAPEPRLSVRYQIDDLSSIKASSTSTQQYIHLVSNSNSTLPTDIWVPSGSLVRPQKGTQFATGYFRTLLKGTVDASVEVYYKDMRNQIEFEDGYAPTLNEEIETRFVFGQGNSYGAELFIRKNRGRITGWIGYTLSKTTRKFPQINGGKEFPATYDRRHDLSVVSTFKATDRLSVSAVFVFGTGQAYTLPDGWYFIENTIVEDIGVRNGHRLADYHRLDLSATLRGKSSEKFKSNWNFSIYNVYNRLNPYFIFFEQSGSSITGDAAIVAKQVSLFPIIPSISWQFEF